MGIGVISLVTSQKREQSGPPFVAGSAYNGTSIDGTGRIVLGNDVGQAGSPAELISDREIITEDSFLNIFAVVLNSVFTGIVTRLDGQAIALTGAANTNPIFTVTSGANGNSVIRAASGDSGNSALDVLSGDNSVAQLNVLAGAGSSASITVTTDTDSFRIEPTGPGQIDFLVNAINMWRINTVAFTTQFGPTLVADNGATVQVSGSLTNRLFTQGQGAGTYNVDRDLDSAKLFTNSAAANLALPNMAGANARPGFTIAATCNNAAGITITASAGQTIRFGSLATSSGGTISSTDVGAFVRITNITSATWVTETFNGAWVLT